LIKLVELISDTTYSREERKRAEEPLLKKRLPK
jgi:hypothetical protein